MKKYTKSQYLLFLEKVQTKPIDKNNLKLLNNLIRSTDERKFTQFLDFKDEQFLFDCIAVFLEKKENLIKVLRKSYERFKELEKSLFNIIAYFSNNETEYEYFFLKGLIDGEDFLEEAYKALKIGKNFETIKNRDDYINQLKGLDLMLQNKNKEFNESQNIQKKKRKKKKNKNKNKNKVNEDF